MGLGNNILDGMEDTMKKKEIIDSYTGKHIGSPIKAIREYCMECCMYSAFEVKECQERVDNIQRLW